MRTFQNIELKVEPIQVVELPFNTEVLDLYSQKGVPYLSVISDDTQKLIKRTIHIFAPGKELPHGFNQTNFLGAFHQGTHRLSVFQDNSK